MESAGSSPGEALDYVATHARGRPGKLACVDLVSGQRLTYGDFERRIRRCAGDLAQRLGAGEVAAVLSHNAPDVLVVQFACVRAGAVFLPLNWRLTPKELEVVVEDAAPRLLIYAPEFETTAKAIAGASPGVQLLALGPDFDAALDASPSEIGDHPIDPDLPATLLYTSGTTGRPKGVIITERNAFATAVNMSLAAHVGPDSVFLCEVPMFHVVGLMAVCRSTLLQGGTLLISPKFEPARTLDRLKDPALGVTHYFCVPQMAQMLRQEPGFRGEDLAHLTAFCTGGAPHAATAIRRWVGEGVRLIDGYGMSEAGTVLTMPPSDLEVIARKAGAAGLPGVRVQIRLVDGEGRDTPDGEVGEIWLRGASVSPGYWKRPDATAQSRTDGWLRTGDAARRDADGFYTIVERLKDMFISGGENVYPSEVEAAILELDGVAEAAVIGLPDERWGEIGCAFVVPVRGAALSAEAVLGHCRGRLAGYKIPKTVLMADALPRTPSGKVQKHVLRAQRIAELAENGA